MPKRREVERIELTRNGYLVKTHIMTYGKKEGYMNTNDQFVYHKTSRMLSHVGAFLKEGWENG